MRVIFSLRFEAIQNATFITIPKRNAPLLKGPRRTRNGTTASRAPRAHTRQRSGHVLVVSGSWGSDKACLDKTVLSLVLFRLVPPETDLSTNTFFDRTLQPFRGLGWGVGVHGPVGLRMPDPWRDGAWDGDLQTLAC